MSMCIGQEECPSLPTHCVYSLARRIGFTPAFSTHKMNGSSSTTKTIIEPHQRMMMVCMVVPAPMDSFILPTRYRSVSSQAASQKSRYHGRRCNNCLRLVYNSTLSTLAVTTRVVTCYYDTTLFCWKISASAHWLSL